MKRVWLQFTNKAKTQNRIQLNEEQEIFDQNRQKQSQLLQNRKEIYIRIWQKQKNQLLLMIQCIPLNLINFHFRICMEDFKSKNFFI